MKATWLFLGAGLLGIGLIGAYAQDRRPLFGAPPVLPTEDKTQSAKTPFQTQPVNAKKKAADASMIVPPEAYDVPRLIGPANVDLTERKGVVAGETSEVVPAQAVEPMVPPQELKFEKNVPLLPPLEPSPMPVLEPTKALVIEPTGLEVPAKKKPPVVELPPIVETPAKEPAKKPPVVELPPVVMPPLPASIPREPAKKVPVIEAPSAWEPKKEPLLPPPSVFPPLEEPKKEPLLTPLPEPKKEPLLPAPIVLTPLPEPKKEALAPLPVTQPIAPLPHKPQGFVRIESATPPATALPQIGPHIAPESVLPPPPPIAHVSSKQSGLASAQTPSVIVEKRGAPSLRAGDTSAYQFAVRNQGPLVAQQIRIEEELPPGVQVIASEPSPTWQGTKAIWILPPLAVNHEQTVRFTLKATADIELANRMSVHVGAGHLTNTTSLRPRNDGPALAIQLTGPNQVGAGKPAVFEIHVVNNSAQPLSGLVLHGNLSDGLTSPAGNRIEGEVDVTIAPGESKTLKMPATAVTPGRHTVGVRVTAQGGHEATATTIVEVASESLQLNQAPATRLYMARDGDLRIEVANFTAKTLRNVAVADQLPEGIEFVAASDRGLFQANRRTVYWWIDQLPAGKSQTLTVRVNGTKAGNHQNVVFAKADGIAETQSTGAVTLDRSADLSLRVVAGDNLLELGKETVYEVQVQNPGNAFANNVRLEVQFPPGLTPKSAEAKTRHSIDRQTVVFEPVAGLEGQGQLTFRVTAVAQSVGDQRVRFSLTSDQVRTPFHREVSTRVYADRGP